MFNTPVVKLNKIIDENSAEVYAKLKMSTQDSSVKDRFAFSMIQNAEKIGKLKPSYVIVELTNGNTGIDLT